MTALHDPVRDQALAIQRARMILRQALPDWMPSLRARALVDVSTRAIAASLPPLKREEPAVRANPGAGVTRSVVLSNAP